MTKLYLTAWTDKVSSPEPAKVWIAELSREHGGGLIKSFAWHASAAEAELAAKLWVVSHSEYRLADEHGY